MTRRDALFDALAMAVAVSLVAVSLLGPPSNAAYGPAGIAVECAALGLLPFRRRAPLLTGWLLAASAVAMAVVEAIAPGTLVHTGMTPLVPLAATPFLAYSALAFAADQRVALAPVAILAIVAARPWEPTGPGVTQALLITAAPALLGMYLSARRRLVTEALAAQRARLAAEMHDTITHRLSLIVLRAGLLGMTARDAETRAAAAELRAAGCQALEELQEVVHVLHDESGDSIPTRHSPAPVPELAPLIAESRSAGVAAQLVEEGDPAAVAPVIRRTAHRVVQEALTNVRKHAPGAAVRVRARYGGDGVHVTVHNTGSTRAADPALAATGSGTGLHNLRQRVEMIGGTLHTGRATDGGFQVCATLPAPAA
ncbi:sensor histidine kinase [Amycolatopsis anabasis]|uniref:sensor histidine kinase n=1 Tax=Amycolatopsis anabasis TaxID=1840409 RepID=UPI00131A860D|nr:sensor histidine kinase [Amycolatopsis anabasis]